MASARKPGRGWRPLKVLFLCTANSARSQIAEALLNARGGGRFIAASAGSNPALRVNPLALRELERAGVKTAGSVPKSIDAVMADEWDLIITVCDHARESCPVFPGRPPSAHWGVPDPAAVGGDDQAREAAFAQTARTIGARLDRLIGLPVETLDSAELEAQVRAIAEAGARLDRD
ncbi:MAG: arsenate reductase ArsC [Longimicrobiales bacterium]